MPPPFVSPLRLGVASPGQPGALLPGTLVALFDPASFTVSYDPATISTGDTSSVTGAARVGLVAPTSPLAGSCSTTDATTSTRLLVVPIPTGYSAWLRFTLTAEIATGGNAGKRVVFETRFLFRNPSGTPAASTGTSTPSDGPLASCDETGGALSGGGLQAPAFAANLVTFSVKGIASTTVKWQAVAEPLFFAE